jgi:predicted nucleic acid-binding protein
VIHITESIEAKAWQIFKRDSDKTFSFTDCTSFVIMQQLDIVKVQLKLEKKVLKLRWKINP